MDVAAGADDVEGGSAVVAPVPVVSVPVYVPSPAVVDVVVGTTGVRQPAPAKPEQQTSACMSHRASDPQPVKPRRQVTLEPRQTHEPAMVVQQHCAIESTTYPLGHAAASSDSPCATRRRQTECAGAAFEREAGLCGSVNNTAQLHCIKRPVIPVQPRPWYWTAQIGSAVNQKHVADES